MKAKSILFILALFFCHLSFSQCPESFHDFSADDINGNPLSMSAFTGKKVLVVNTASYCGYTNQYTTLQQLYSTYGGDSNPYNFEIIGFPANDFNNQEPYGEDSIIAVCDSYGVTFQMMSKVSVKGASIHPIYDWLTKQSRNCVQNAAVQWNFQKFMVNPDGSWHGVAMTTTSPLHSSIVNWITTPVGLNDVKFNQNNLNLFYSVENSTLILDVETTQNQNLTINLYSITGQKVETLFNAYANSSFQLERNVCKYGSGIYIVELIGESFRQQKKVVFF